MLRHMTSQQLLRSPPDGSTDNTRPERRGWGRNGGGKMEKSEGFKWPYLVLLEPNDFVII